MKTIFVCLSGGLDSSVCLGMAKSLCEIECYKVSAVSFRYGSKHNPFELRQAKKLADYYEVDHHIIDITNVMKDFKSNLLKTGGNIPEGHYQDSSMKLTVVPGRNLIFTSILTGFAQSQHLGYSEIWLGIHSGDHAIYPDCRPEFYYALCNTVKASTEGQVQIKAPFLFKDKSSIISNGMLLEVPFNLTRTCYQEEEKACGKCGSCTERLEAFKTNNMKDPIEYMEK